MRHSSLANSAAQRELAALAEPYRDQHPGLALAHAYAWTETRLAPERFNEMSHTEWLAWFANEQRIWALDGFSGRFDSMMHPIQEPVIASRETENGRPVLLIWDGYHRVAAAYRYHHRTVPAMVGRRI